MPIYKYRARNDRGKFIDGRIEAEDEKSAMVDIHALGYLPVSIKEIRAKETKPFAFSRKKIPQRTLIIFTRQLSTMLHSGISIIASLTALIDETENKDFKEVLSKIKSDIHEGISLSEALSKHPQIFSKLYISTLAAGETGGVLDEILKRLSEMLEHEAEIQAGVKSALRYPITVIIAIITAFFVLTTFVVPKFMNVFCAGKAALPLPTRVLIVVNNVVRGYWFYIIPAVIILAIAVKMYVKTRRGEYQWDFIKLKLPVFGDLIKKMVSSRFAQMLMTLDNAGLPFTKSLEVISFTLGNSVFAKEIESLKKSVLEGAGIGEPLLKSRFFPKLVAHMVTIGEKSGSLGEMLDSIQHHYDTEVNITIKNLTTLIEPILVVGLGLVVLFLALGIFLPMWDLMSAVKGGV